MVLSTFLRRKKERKKGKKKISIESAGRIYIFSLLSFCSSRCSVESLKRNLTVVGFEPTPQVTSTWNWRLRPLGHTVWYTEMKTTYFIWTASHRGNSLFSKSLEMKMSLTRNSCASEILSICFVFHESSVDGVHAWRTYLMSLPMHSNIIYANINNWKIISISRGRILTLGNE